MTIDEIVEKLKSKYLIELQPTKPDPSIKVESKDIAHVIKMLKEELNFETIANLGGIDFPQNNQLCVFYHLFSYTHKFTVCLKVFLPRDMPSVPTVSHLYKGANWLERETYDMYGIIFTDHPDLCRILCPDDWEGFPLRKDYQTPDYYNGMPVPLYFDNAGTPSAPLGEKEA